MHQNIEAILAYCVPRLMVSSPNFAQNPFLLLYKDSCPSRFWTSLFEKHMNSNMVLHTHLFRMGRLSPRLFDSSNRNRIL